MRAFAGTAAMSQWPLLDLPTGPHFRVTFRFELSHAPQFSGTPLFQTSAQCCTLSKRSTAACRHRLRLLDPTGILEPRMHILHYRCVWKRCPCFVHMVILDSYKKPEPQTPLPSTHQKADRSTSFDRSMYAYIYPNWTYTIHTYEERSNVTEFGLLKSMYSNISLAPYS